jgi:hypothetical protein
VPELTHDTADEGFHEIQLSGKQVIFLFMTTVVAAVAIFLLGVQVGRNVKGDRPAEPADTLASAANSLPPAPAVPVPQPSRARPLPPSRLPRRRMATTSSAMRSVSRRTRRPRST